MLYSQPAFSFLISNSKSFYFILFIYQSLYRIKMSVFAIIYMKINAKLLSLFVLCLDKMKIKTKR